MRRLVFQLMLATLATAPVHAQIFAGQDPSGGVVLSNFRTEQATELLIAAPAGPAPAMAVHAPRPERIADLIRKVAIETALPPALLQAVIAVESGFNASAVSSKGALGLMQLMPATARRFGVLDPFDPSQNIAGGAAYLKTLLTRFDGDVELALAAYNAGEAAVIKAGNRIPPYSETRAYVPRVLAHVRRAASY